MSIYEQLKEKHPDKEIKMIPARYLPQYEKYGFKSIYSWTEKSNVTGEKIDDYCFIIEA
jgi:hypothetical protein